MNARRLRAAGRWARLLLPISTLALLPCPGSAAGIDFGDRKPGVIADGKLTPGRPPAARYGANPEWVCPSRGVFGAIADDLKAIARQKGKPEPKSDGRLCLVAETFLSWDPKTEPGDAVLEGVARFYGLPVPPYKVTTTTVTSEDPATIVENLGHLLGPLSSAAAVPRYGVATQRLRKDLVKVVLAFADGRLEFEPFPRRLAAGEKVAITGQVLGDFENPKIQISDAVGRFASPDQPAGKTLQAEIACGDKPGGIRVAVRAELGGIPTLLARFPVACGTELPASVALTAPAWPVEPPAQEKRILELINAERAAAGLGAVAWDDTLTTVARGISEDMKRTLAVPDDVVARLKKVGIASSLVVQNPSQGKTAVAAWDLMQSSPSHRSNMMMPEANLAGVGLVAGADAVFVTQLFIKELPPLDPVATREKLRAAVIQKRKDGRFPAAVPDPDLEAFAQTYAKELAAAGGSLPKARQAELTKALDKRFKAVAMTSGARQEPLDFAEEPEVTSPGKLFGVGVAQGMHEKLGRNAVYAVIAVGQERGGKDAEPAPTKKAKKK